MRPTRAALLFALVIPCLSCGEVSYSKDELIQVGIEAGEGYTVRQPFVQIKPGQNALFHIDLEDKFSVTGCSYWKNRIVNTKEGCDLTLFSVRYPTIVSLTLSSSSIYIDPNITSSSSSHSSSSTSSSQDLSPQEDPIEDGSPKIVPFDSNATTMKVSKGGPHIRAHAPNGLKYFNYRGYIQTGWNTKQDGSGESIGFGWRYDKSIETLYGEFVPITPLDKFEFQEGKRACKLIAYHGEDKTVVVPRFFNGKQVTSIAANAITSEEIEELVLPPNLRRIDSLGVNAPNLRKLTFYDRLRILAEDSFRCPNLETVRLNALEEPCFSGTYWDGFQDKIDYLWKNKDKKKIVLFSGSSTRYGYFSPQIKQAYPDYEVVNMGVFAYFGIFQQLEIITSYLKEGDILIHAPEFDAIQEQFGMCRSFDYRFFFCLESGFQELARIDLRRIAGFFSCYAKFQDMRANCIKLSYDEHAYHYDDDDNYYEDFIYNENGDMTLYRPNTDFSGRISQPLLDYSVPALFGDCENAASTLDALYHEYEERCGVRIFFTYAPKNLFCLSPESDYSSRISLDGYLRDKISVPFLGGIEESLFETAYLYKIDNHLSTEGAQLRTSYVISWLTGLI